MVDSIYDDFVAKAAAGRGVAQEEMEAIARGRVWTGEQAMRVGLVDALGGLDDAIAAAAAELHLEEGGGGPAEVVPFRYPPPMAAGEVLAQLLRGGPENSDAVEAAAGAMETAGAAVRRAGAQALLGLLPQSVRLRVCAVADRWFSSAQQGDVALMTHVPTNRE